MNILKNISRPLMVFYFFLTYILIFVGWWTILHLKNINERYDLEKQAIILTHEQNKLSNIDAQASPRYKEAIVKEKRQKMMIIGESFVFLLILMFGAYQTHTGIRKEVMLNRQQRNFLLSITHELKSPIASIKLAVETMLRRHLKREMQEKLLGNALKDSDRLGTLVENILMASKIENRSITFAKEIANFSKLVEEIAYKMTDDMAHNRALTLNVEPDVFLEGDRMALVSIIQNLVENAIKYSPKDTPIEVGVTRKGERAKLTVADNGTGIPTHLKRKIFTKFYRIGNEDTRQTKGTGLGLYLVKQLIDLHEGNITVTDNQPKGSIFVVELPCKAAEPKKDELVKHVA